MKQVTLGELERCAAEYEKVDRRKLSDKAAWMRDRSSLKVAIEKAKRGVPVYVTNNVGVTLNGQENYYLLAASDELEATLCANHLSHRNP